MKQEYSSDAEDVQWVSARVIQPGRAINFVALPNKKVRVLIAELEAGEFPVVFVDPNTDVTLARSWGHHEAYLRCHISVIPVVYLASDQEDIQRALEEEPND